MLSRREPPVVVAVAAAAQPGRPQARARALQLALLPELVQPLEPALVLQLVPPVPAPVV
jgi:hypothetical protein